MRSFYVAYREEQFLQNKICFLISIYLRCINNWVRQGTSLLTLMLAQFITNFTYICTIKTKTMSTLIVNIDKQDKTLLMAFLKKLKATVKEISETDKEDLGLLNAMLKGRKNDFVDKSVIMKELRK